MKLPKTEDEVLEVIAEILQQQELEVTGENVLKASIMLMRRQAYTSFPAARPEIVEALLLMFQVFYYDVCDEIDKADNLTEAQTSELMKETYRFGRCIQKTLAKMNA